jgi:hypothetical protein
VSFDTYAELGVVHRFGRVSGVPPSMGERLRMLLTTQRQVFACATWSQPEAWMRRLGCAVTATAAAPRGTRYVYRPWPPGVYGPGHHLHLGGRRWLVDQRRFSDLLRRRRGERSICLIIVAFHLRSIRPTAVSNSHRLHSMYERADVRNARSGCSRRSVAPQVCLSRDSQTANVRRAQTDSLRQHSG